MKVGQQVNCTGINFPSPSGSTIWVNGVVTLIGGPHFDRNRIESWVVQSDMGIALVNRAYLQPLLPQEDA